jgi:omega-6 fatty acid desaturase (delta-12 desaturase)
MKFRVPLGAGDRAEMNSDAASMTSSWKHAVAACQKPVLRSSIWQIVNTLAPYFALWGLMIWTSNHSYWLTFAIALLAAGFFARMFMIFHDCGHGSFFESQRANHFLGFITGVLTFTPYYQWRHKHALHHATSGDLDRRGTGDIWTLTVREYVEAPRWKRIAYRLFRNPFVLFLAAPLYLFLIHHRFPSRGIGKRERRGVHRTNGALMAIAVLTSLMIGLKAYLLIQLSVMMMAGTAGLWLFYVQHQFDGVYWERRENWHFAPAALRGSSFYKLPGLLQWFTANIGFHHIHHLSPAIPNYNLERCHGKSPMFQEVKAVTFWSSMKSLSFRLWDEERRRFVGFGRISATRREELLGDRPFNSPVKRLARGPGAFAGPRSRGESSCVNS